MYITMMQKRASLQMGAEGVSDMVELKVDEDDREPV